MLLMLLAAVVIAGFLLYTYFSSERSAEYPEAGTQINPADAELLGNPEADADPAEPQEAEPAEPSAVQSSDDEVAAEPEPAAVPAPRTARPVAAAPQAQQAQQEDAVAEAEEPAPARAAPADNDAGASRTVRAFYSALSAGDGSSAAQLVVPAKRRSGPLSAGALSRYYSSFRRPLRVQSVTPVDANTVRVAYDYVLADGRVCRGQAAVDVVQRDGRSLVSGIRTRGPC
jgi:type IV secretory pathway VirB10-like protein